MDDKGRIERFEGGWPAGGAVRRWLGRFRRDQRGGTAVQAIALLPVVLVAFLGMIRVWQTVQIRDSLHTGTYLAMRYLSLYPPETKNTTVWASVAEKWIFEELKNNPWVDKQSLIAGSPNSLVQVTLIDGDYECTNKFEIRVTYVFDILGAGDPVEGTGLPGAFHMTMEDVRQGEVLCK